MLNFKCAKNNLTIEDIKRYYLNAQKPRSEFKFGLEYERLSLNIKDNKSAPYEKIKKIIENFADLKGWGKLYDDKVLIGAMGEGSSISLEPGRQLELSLAPKKYLGEIETSAKEILNMIDGISKLYGVKYVGYGISPVSVADDINIVQKERYKIMAKILPEFGELSPLMMRETAGVQLNVDFESEKDAIVKIKALNIISPILTGLFANSPIRNNSKTGFKSYRAHVWKNTDKNRTGVFYKNMFEKEHNTFEDYINAILNVPMVFVERNNKKIPLHCKMTFSDFMKTGHAKIEDYILHSSLCFPDIRLKNCIEIRNHDSQNFKNVLCIAAFYKGFLNSDLSEILKDFRGFKADDIEAMGNLAAREGISFEYKNINAKKYAKKLFEIAENNLAPMEKDYLKPALLLLEKGICPADLILNANANNSEDLFNILSKIG